MAGHNRKDMTGKSFDRLKVIQFSHVQNKLAYWICKCFCGNIITTAGSRLRNGSAKSCGCYKLEILEKNWIKTNNCFQIKHGHRINNKNTTPTYNSWRGMIERCRNPKHIAYNNYGARGIQVCDRWKIFDYFLKDMGKRPKGMTIDRINVNGDYQLDNCRWTDYKTQANNKRKKS